MLIILIVIIILHCIDISNHRVVQLTYIFILFFSYISVKWGEIKMKTKQRAKGKKQNGFDRQPNCHNGIEL